MHDRIGQPGDITHSSVATRAVNIRPDMRKVRRLDVYYRRYRTAMQVALGLGVTLAAVAVVLWRANHGIWSAVVALPALVVLFFAFNYRQALSGDAYSSGLLVPGLLTSVEPLELVVAAEVETGGEDNPQGIVWGVRRVTLPQLTVHPEQVGEQVPCVVLFGSSEAGVYTNFEPRPLAWGTDDMAVLQAAHAAIVATEWQVLAQLAALYATSPKNDNDIAYFDAQLQPVAMAAESA